MLLSNGTVCWGGGADENARYGPVKEVPNMAPWSGLILIQACPSSSSLSMSATVQPASKLAQYAGCSTARHGRCWRLDQQFSALSNASAPPLALYNARRKAWADSHLIWSHKTILYSTVQYTLHPPPSLFPRSPHIGVTYDTVVNQITQTYAQIRVAFGFGNKRVYL
jgi:hypothetical protein